VPPFAPTALLVPDPEIGSIVIWQGAIVNIPAKWTLCNGLNGTPDLRDQMVIGSNGTYAHDSTGGASEHDHFLTTDGHDHTFPCGTDLDTAAYKDATTDINVDFCDSDKTANLPPYYSLAFIMYLG